MTQLSRRGWIGLLAALALPVPALAQLTVIHDTGNTASIAPYLTTWVPAESRGLTPAAGTPGPDRQPLGPAQLSHLLPIHSPGLTPGALSPHTGSEDTLARLALGHAPPFFLVGSDALSLHWLESRRAELQQLGAVGMLVQAQTEDDVRAVAQLAQGLPITLGSASDLAQALGISRYPVLISKHGVEQ